MQFRHSSASGRVAIGMMDRIGKYQPMKKRSRMKTAFVLALLLALSGLAACGRAATPVTVPISPTATPIPALPTSTHIPTRPAAERTPPPGDEIVALVNGTLVDARPSQHTVRCKNR
jgi:predicted small lipoprotein YifL